MVGSRTGAGRARTHKRAFTGPKYGGIYNNVLFLLRTRHPGDHIDDVEGEEASQLLEKGLMEKREWK